MAFATIADIEVRWRTLTADEQDRATVLLDDATAMLFELVQVDESDDQQLDLLRIVCCNMVVRSMVASSSDAYGVNEVQAMMGPFQQRTVFANPSGDMYLTKAEKRMLHIGAGKGRVLRPEVGLTRGGWGVSHG